MHINRKHAEAPESMCYIMQTDHPLQYREKDHNTQWLSAKPCAE